MGQTKLSLLRAYVGADLARLARQAAQPYGGNVSAYLRELLERELVSGAGRDPFKRDLHYLKTSVDAMMDEVQMLRLPPDKIAYRDPLEPSLRTIVTRIHKARMAEVSDAD